MSTKMPPPWRKWTRIRYLGPSHGTHSTGEIGYVSRTYFRFYGRQRIGFSVIRFAGWQSVARGPARELFYVAIGRPS